MSRISKPSANSELLKRCILLCMGVCLLFALTPFSDFDFDGSLDSFLTDSLLLVPAQPATIVPVLFSTRFLTAYLISPELLPFLIVPPPVAF